MALKLEHKDIKAVNEIKKIIAEKNTFLITSHYNIDGDAIGSELALYIQLKKLGKNVQVANHDKTPEVYKFLPFASGIKNIPSRNFRKPEVCIIVDCGELERAGAVADIVKKSSLVINIDHHFSNKRFGSVNFTGHQYSATGEMVYLILEKFGKISKEQAACLYTAIMTDTGNFVYNFGAHTMSIARHLIEYGADPEKIAKKVYMEKPLKFLKLLAAALETFQYDRDAGVCWMSVDKEMYKATGANEEHTEGFVELLASIKEFKAAFLLKENKGVRASLRSKGGYDVEKIARKFGGGGHKQASGCKFDNDSIPDAAKKILAEIKKHHGRYNNCK